FICAIDGDLLGLEGTHYNWRKKEWVTVHNGDAAFKFWSDMITGQTGDNIKGVPGKGQAFVKKLFNSVFEGETDFYEEVFRVYVEHFGLHEGIHEFYKNYVSLKILEKKEGFVIPEPNELIIKQ